MHTEKAPPEGSVTDGTSSTVPPAVNIGAPKLATLGVDDVEHVDVAGMMETVSAALSSTPVIWKQSAW